MKKTPIRKRLLCIALVAILASCSEEPIKLSQGIKVDNTTTQATLTPYYFNWETTDYVPTPPGTTVLVPWASNTNQGFSQDIRYDYKASDGWELVYNTFSPSAIVEPKSMIFYNKYRGLLRFYLYVSPYNAPAPGDYIINELSLEAANGATSPMLNFTGSDIIWANQKTLIVPEVIPYRVNSTSGWYALQHEIAYDPSITSQTYQNLNLRWAARSVSVSQVTMSGTVSGTIKSPVSKPTKLNFLNTLSKGVTSLTGLAILEDPDFLPEPIRTAAKTALNSGFQGIVKNVFSAVFGGNSNNPQSVDLKLNASIKITGTEVTNSGLMDNVFVIPGVSNSQSTPGFAPRYNQPLGVFNISAVPVIKYTATMIPDPYIEGGTNYRRFSFNIVSTSYTIQFNPAVTSIATITNIQQKIVGLTAHTYDQSNGTSEYIGDYPNLKTGMTYLLDYYDHPPVNGDFLLRISFDVVPNNGAPKSTIVKTFRTTLVKA